MVKQNVLYADGGVELLEKLSRNSLRFPRRTVIAGILLVALMAFELFNFDTTRFALASLLGPVSFLGVGWASILAIAFCAIDFAGLVRLFTPEAGGEQPKEVWYLMGAWLLGATMNALMTWWAVSLTLLNHEFGNEVLSRGQLLQIVPIFVATLVWLTRILFIGALTVTGSHIVFAAGDEQVTRGKSGRLPAPTGRPVTERALTGRMGSANGLIHGLPHVSDELPDFLRERRGRESIGSGTDGRTARHREEVQEKPSIKIGARLDETEDDTRTEGHRRVKQRPPVPGSNGYGDR